MDAEVNKVILSDSHKFNLPSLIRGVYGEESIERPAMQKLFERNDFNKRDFLSGADEAQPFKDRQYVNLHKSTISKVYSFQDVYKLLQRRKLQVHKRKKIQVISD